MVSIMVIEDEKNIRDLLVKSLRMKGYGVLAYGSFEDGLRHFYDDTVDIVLLDVMLPGKDGFMACKELREMDPDLGIIMLTAKSQQSDMINGLSSGADDYIKKPFSLNEVFARVESVLRKVKRLRKLNGKQSDISDGNISLNYEGNQLIIDNSLVDLTNIESEIVKLFLSNTNESLTRDYILDKVWGKNYFGSYKIVDVNIQRIRKKIISIGIENPIETVRGRGYRWIKRM